MVNKSPETASSTLAVKKAIKNNPQPPLIGIVSTRPAILIEGEQARIGGPRVKGTYDSGEKAPIALVGRVPVKVTTENGEIQRGDLITISSEPGIGMKAINEGWVVGVALTPYNGSGVGEVTAYVKPTWYGGEPKEEEKGITESIMGWVKQALESLGFYIEAQRFKRLLYPSHYAFCNSFLFFFWLSPIPCWFYIRRNLANTASIIWSERDSNHPAFVYRLHTDTWFRRYCNKVSALYFSIFGCYLHRYPPHKRDWSF